MCLTYKDIPTLCTISSGQLPCTAYSWQSCLFRLRLVCQTFNQVFEQSARLNSHVYVSKLVQSCSLPSLVEWLRRHRNHVKRLNVQHGSVWLESLLVALQSPDTCLEKVDVAASLPSSIVMLSTFQSITECSLHSDFFLDLQALSALPQLTRLALQRGHFLCLDAAAHLTALTLKNAQAECMQECCFVTSLMELSLYNAELIRFYSRNVAACLNLQSLSVCEAYIGSTHSQQEFDLSNVYQLHIPSGLSALTALTRLQLECANRQCVNWVTVLSALQSFQLYAGGAVFPVSWNTMTNLKDLTVHMDIWGNASNSTLFEFDWCSLTLLERLSLRFVDLSEQEMANLVLLPSLIEVDFEGVRATDIDTANQIATVAFHFGCHK